MRFIDIYAVKGGQRGGNVVAMGKCPEEMSGWKCLGRNVRGNVRGMSRENGIDPVEGDSFNCGLI